MPSWLLDLLLSPLDSFVSKHIVSINGIDYVPADSFYELFAGSLDLVIDVLRRISQIAFFEVFSFAMLSGAAIFLVKAFRYHRKDIEK